MHVVELARHGVLWTLASRLGGSIAAILILTAATIGFCENQKTATLDYPATVQLKQESNATRPACDSCGERTGATLELKLQILHGTDLIVRLFLDKPIADLNSSTEDSAFVGSLALSPANGSSIQKFALTLPKLEWSSEHQLTIVVMPVGSNIGVKSSLLIEDARVFMY